MDNGTGGDAMAGDGIFSATIPGQAANTIVAFYISATDSLGAATRFPALLTDNDTGARMRGHVWRRQSRRQFRRLSFVDHADQCDALGQPAAFEQ